MTERDAVATVAAGTGIVLLPQSVARLHHRKDVVQRFVADLPGTTIGLVWRVDDEDERVQAFIGIVRGRTARSSRG
jgi:DNA-binding transcriptional LysR family regulator